MNKPLDGVTVIDFTIYLAGPSAGKILADWGARVIKIEPPGGEPGRWMGGTLGMRTDEESNPFWEVFNSGKESISINMKTAKGKKIMDRLLKKANIFISNCRLSALKKLGLDYETMSAAHPHIIWGQLSGYGLKGREALKPGFDAAAFFSRTGALLDLAEKGGSPLTNPFGLGDIPAGLALAGGVVACLHKQATEGRGERVVTSLYATGIWHSACLIQSTWHGDDWPKSRKKPFSPLCNSFLCRDGVWMYVTIMDYARHFPALCKITGSDNMLDDDRFKTEAALRLHNEEFTKIMDETYISKNYEEWDLLLSQADIVHDRIRHFKEVSQDNQALVNNFIYFGHDRNGLKEIIPATPVHFGSWSLEHSQAPLCGENTDEIMRELGYSQNDIEQFKQSKIVS